MSRQDSRQMSLGLWSTKGFQGKGLFNHTVVLDQELSAAPEISTSPGYSDDVHVGFVPAAPALGPDRAWLYSCTICQEPGHSPAWIQLNTTFHGFEGEAPQQEHSEVPPSSGQPFLWPQAGSVSCDCLHTLSVHSPLEMLTFCLWVQLSLFSSLSSHVNTPKLKLHWTLHLVQIFSVLHLCCPTWTKEELCYTLKY